ncbi:MAG: hypothetical protein A2V70_08170 [Planctomycetes bacterium RBG_13_63_9]|nr:MAG: hypothetical protein A2V70_08170 [Planctomycetes bacterium RBG_13_63_9]
MHCLSEWISIRMVTALLIAAPLVAAAQVVASAGIWAAEDLQPPGQVERRIQELIQQLGDEDYFVREQAQAELAKLSVVAFDALNAATTHEDLEIAARAKYLLGLMRVEWVAKDAPPEVRRLLADYELQDDQEKLSRIDVLAKLPGGRGVTTLCRLLRFERSPALSKHAAVELLELLPHDEPPAKDLARQLRTDLEGSRRAAAQWVLTRLRLDEDPHAALGDWAKLIDTEHALLNRSPPQTSAPIVAKLVRYQIHWLKKLDRMDQAMTAMRRLVDLEKGNPETLAELLEWLIEQKAWKVVDELAERFAPQFSTHPTLLYALARAQAEQGDGELADQTAQGALKLHPGDGATQLRMHYETARVLQQQGQLQWAEREYRYLIDSGTPGTPVVAASQNLLAEMLHDQGKDQQAGTILKNLVEAVEARPGGAGLSRPALAPIHSRMNYFFACHSEKEKDPARQYAFLDKAIEADASDIDVLIACYRIADRGPEYHQKILGRIKEETESLREQIADDATDSTPCNQLAWLVGNTEGDFDEALKYSKNSIELNPDYSGYYDTLAHVYFGKGDYENAYKTQLKAVELEPHSGLIVRKLELFRKKWEETRTKQQQDQEK